MTKTNEAPAAAAVEVTGVQVEAHKDGITTLRDRHGVALRLWSTSGPKDVGGKISAVFLQDAEPPRVVMLHQLDNGKFSIWERA